MDKKTMGSFMAALRKSKGLTQQEVADRLNMSNKTVSKWERDDGYPEITLIPVIAELFGVTSDDILKGERITQASQEKEPRGEKQLSRLIGSTSGRFKNASVIALGIAILGYILLLTLSYAFYLPVLGFGILAACITASIVCEVIFFGNAKAALKTGDMASAAFLTPAYRILYKWLCVILCVNVSFLVIALPFVITHNMYYFFYALPLGEYVMMMPIYLIICAILSVIIAVIVRKAFSVRGFKLTEYSEETKQKLRKLTRKFLIVTLICTVVFGSTLVLSLSLPVSQKFASRDDLCDYVLKVVQYRNDPFRVWEDERISASDIIKGNKGSILKSDETNRLDNVVGWDHETYTVYFHPSERFHPAIAFILFIISPGIAISVVYAVKRNQLLSADNQ